ncbi:MAG: hypothetical protein CL687_00680 [Candidatus Pelagibacter sp.]|nr:hypothetical protein [Candidatus Pelagibacter sp.]OUW24739.1 MAG: hypothetical protein CBD34_00075 [Rickettsiales bacterium TMED174]|tara:strand:- start:178 stop:795 length:618 start_codon:yes stop_codon:yes gene_type:complete
MKLKVCGLTKTNQVETCIQNKVDYCGFILNFQKSHRFISLKQAKILTELKKGETKFVGVLVNPSEEELERFSGLKLDYFQLYGNYDSQSLLNIKKRYKKKLITTIQVNRQEDVYKYKKIESETDIILWDSSGYEKSIGWNYNWLRSINTKVKKMVAGNINIEKLDELVGLTDIVDVSGALETNKVKDIIKIKIFINELKKINDTN